MAKGLFYKILIIASFLVIIFSPDSFSVGLAIIYLIFRAALMIIESVIEFKEHQKEEGNNEKEQLTRRHLIVSMLPAVLLILSALVLFFLRKDYNLFE
ncbi:MAG: hypothetical protein J5I50_12910 [Chitinophagaceae bacterium]|nr:hypothetical protein [Chitinophagaceae bacterium]